MKKPVVLSAVVLLIAGWGITPPSPSVNAQTPLVAPQTLPDATESAAEAKSTIVLLYPGAQPRQILRFKPAANTKQTTVLTMNMDMTGTVDGQVMPNINMPAIQMSVESEVTQVEANGDAQIKVTYTEVDVVSDKTAPPELIRTLRAQLQQLKDVTITFVIDEQGITKDVNVSLPEDLDPNLEQLLQQMLSSLEQLSAVPFPEEAVGVGATWQVSSAVPVSELPLDQIQVLYEVEDIEDDQVTLKMSMQQQSQESSQMDLPGAPPGVNFKVQSFATQSAGTMTIGFDRIMPLNGMMSTLSNMEFLVTAPESDQETLMRMSSSVQIMMDSP
ncbi:MAG: hypothetical protein RIM23_00405 [Coleofasciculus sp. G3-WIS-01]|uniref:hypothetical protein n=1 Tax=Coleofasciculus sp. G3-WIS-01 TaxID=3069528 RepID=UPI003304D938